MNEWSALIGFIFLFFIAIAVAVYPMRQHRVLMGVIAPLMAILVFGAYWQWGSWAQWTDFLHQQEKQAQAEVMLKTIGSPQVLIQKLKARVEQEPSNPKGWYLLGRLYASQSDWSNAQQAFSRAMRLKEDEQTAVQYAYSLWESNHRQFTDPIRAIYQSILQKKPKQPDALSMLAMDAYIEHAYSRAIFYWETLLNTTPMASEEAQSIRKAISKAQRMM